MYSHSIYASLYSLVIGLIIVAQVAAEHPFTKVPPTLEMEILDPGVDPNGNAAVRLNSTGNVTSVEIPPVVVVHKYYYSGDRSFQGPMLPGGPTIIVLNHPQTGEKCYIPAQIIPGAPRVKYTKHGIEYDYGERGISITFGLGGCPVVKYRNGKSWTQKTVEILHVSQIHQHLTSLGEHTKSCGQRTKTMTYGLAAGLKDSSKVVTLPAQNLLRMMPFGAAVTSGELEQQLTEKAAKHKQEHEVKRVQQQNKLQQLDRPTLR